MLRQVELDSNASSIMTRGSIFGSVGEGGTIVAYLHHVIFAINDDEHADGGAPY